MVSIAATCGACGFDNPRGWVSCARCGQLLGPQQRLESPREVSEPAGPSPSRAAAGIAGPPAPSEDATRLFDPKALAGDARPLIGRESVLSQLKATIMRAFGDSAPALLAIEGSRGSGKTRLLQRASELAAQQDDRVRVLYASCRHREDGPYAPFSRLLLERFGITPASSPSQVRVHMTSEVTEALGTAEATRVMETTHLLGHLAGVPFPDSPLLKSLAGDPWELHKRASAAMRRFLTGDARTRPTLVLLDDMGQAENDAWELLDILMEAQAPIAFVVTGQEPVAEFARELSPAARVETIALEPLNTEQTAELVRALVPGLMELPDPFASALAHRCRGNPSALKEMINALMERGLFIRTAGGLTVDLAKFESGDQPLTMADAIRARLGGLNEVELRMIRRAAVVGERFWDGALLALQRAEEAPSENRRAPLEVWIEDEDEIILSQALTSLEEKGFIVRTADSVRPGHTEFNFQFAGARSTIYNDLEEEVRVRRHAVVARWLSTATGLGVEGMAAIVAPHLERAGLSGRAGRAYLEAASDERRRMRTTMALRYVERALPLISPDDVGLRFDALHARGSLLTTLGRYDEAHDAFRELLQLAWSLGSRGKGGAALNRIARIHRQRGEHSRALDHFKGALSLFRAADDERGVASTLDDMAQVHRLRGDPELALAAAREALEIRVRAQDERSQAVSLNTIGYLELDRGDFEASRSQFEQALAIRERLGDHEGAVQTRIALGRLAFHRRKLDEAIAIFLSSLESAREMANQRFQSYLLSHLAEAYLVADRPEDAAEVLREALELAAGMRDQRILADIERNLGLVALRLGDDSAAGRLDEALRLALEYGSRESIAAAHRGIARLKARTLFDATGRTQNDAERSFRECIRVFRECGNRHEVARTQAELGYHLLERGDVTGAREALQQAHAAMKTLQLPDQAKLAQTLADLGTGVAAGVGDSAPPR